MLQPTFLIAGQKALTDEIGNINCSGSRRIYIEEELLGRRHCHPMGLRKRKAGISYLVDYFDILLCLRISIKLPQSRNLQCDDMKRLHIFILLHCILKDDQIFQIQTHLVN